MGTQHALLSPSASHRWLQCTASPLLEAKEPNRDTDFTREGTLAHAYCAKALKGTLGLPTEGEDAEIDELYDSYYTEDMMDYVMTYVEIVTERYTQAFRKVGDAQLIVEQRLDFSRWVPDSFGTADALIITDGTMEVIDFKYGKGVEVSAEWNTQMMIYALGALDRFLDEYNIERVKMTIIQPRLENLSEFSLRTGELQWWGMSVLKPKAKEAMGGKGRQNPGEWCRFCRVRNSCAKLAGDCLSIAEEFGGRATVSDEDMARRILPKLSTVKAWASSMEEYALDKALSGTRYEGYKLVEGRSVRRITDPAGLAERLVGSGFDPERIYKPKELETLTSLEKLVGKKEFASLAEGLVEKPQGKPTLVPESDKRPAFNRAEDDFKNF